MRSRTAAAAVAAVALLTGCGALADPGDGGGASAPRPRPVTTPGPELFADVADRMVEEGTATFTFSGVGGGETVSGQGAMRFAAEVFDADVELTMPETGRVRAVLLPAESYLALPAAKGLPRGKPWLKVRRESQHRPRQGDAARSSTRCADRSTRPRASACSRPLASVDEVGPATVEGVPTTRHHAVIDLRRATRLADPMVRGQYQSMLDAGVRTLEYDVWLDTSGLPRRFSADIPTTAGLFSVTGIYRDWGKSLRIQRPAKSRSSTPTS